MPLFRFRDSSGDVVERVFPPREAPNFVTHEGRKYTREFGFNTPSSRGWPMQPCYASGVHPSQAQDLRDHFAKHGVRVEVNSDGNPIYENAAQRKRALKCRNMHDRSAF